LCSRISPNCVRASLVNDITPPTVERAVALTSSGTAWHGDGPPRNEQWRQHASCRTTDPDLFFPVGTTGPAIGQIEGAKAVCATCPSKAPCLEYALTTHQDSGIWGGASEEERRAIRRQRRHQAAAS